MSKIPKSKTDFDLLKDEWYKKLEDSGFQDIEQDEERLKSWSSQRYIHSDPVNWAAKFAYHQMATNFLEEYRFKNKLEQAIWEYHANGLSAREIVKVLKSLNVPKHSRQKLDQIITRLKTKMFDLYRMPMKEYHE